MPSLWQWLCCSRRRFAAGRQERRRQKALAERQSAYMVRPTPDDPPPLTDTSSGHAQPNQGGGVDANGNSVMQKLLEAENSRNRKRRRADEIFHHQGRRESAPGGGDLFRLRDRVFKSDRSLSENDTMYGYVPRAMQGMFISTALEGHKVEDYLPNHEIDRFCSLPSAYSSDSNYILPLPSNGDDHANGNHGDPYHDNNGRRHSDARRSSSGDVEDDVFPGEQRHPNVSHDVKPASSSSSSARFLRPTVTNLDDIDVVMETNGDDVGGNMAADAAEDVTKMASGESELTRDGAGRESQGDWMWNTGKKLEEPQGLTVDNDIENIFSCDGEVLY